MAKTPGAGAAPPAVPLVVGPDQTGPVHRQDPIADFQPAVRGGGSIGDERADVDSWSVEGSVLQQREASVRKAKRKDADGGAASGCKTGRYVCESC